MVVLSRGNYPIGVFDSGVGGLNVLKELIRILPHEDFIYLADSRNCPYGTKKAEEIVGLVQRIVAFFENLGVKILVFACNTSSVHLSRFEIPSLPMLGVIIPTVREAVRTTKNKHLAVLATIATITSGVYQELLSALIPDRERKLFFVQCSEFVTAIEKGDIGTKESYRLVYEKLAFLQDEEIDTVILGCTHFDCYRAEIQSVFPQAALVSSGKPTGKALFSLLKRKQIINQQQGSGRIRLLTTGDSISFRKQTLPFFDLPRIEEITL